MKRLEVEIVAWGRQRISWSVDYRVLEGDTTQPAVWKQLEALLDADYPTFYGQTLRIERCAIDSGFQPMTVYDFVRDMLASRVMCIKGNNASSALLNHPTLIEHGPQGQRLKSGVRVWPVNVSIGKEQLYRWLKQAMPDVAQGQAWPVGYCHFPMYSHEYFEQLCSEQLITRIIKGMRRTVWEKRRDRNEALDCRIYAMAAAAALRLEVWSAQKWDDIEKALTIVRNPQSPAKAAPLPVAKPKFERMEMPQFKPFKVNDSFSED
jgi:phage terminase large subunit GpA-like protein